MSVAIHRTGTLLPRIPDGYGTTWVYRAGVAPDPTIVTTEEFTLYGGTNRRFSLHGGTGASAILYGGTSRRNTLAGGTGESQVLRGGSNRRWRLQ